MINVVCTDPNCPIRGTSSATCYRCGANVVQTEPPHWSERAERAEAENERLLALLREALPKLNNALPCDACNGYDCAGMPIRPLGCLPDLINRIGAALNEGVQPEDCTCVGFHTNCSKENQNA